MKQRKALIVAMLAAPLTMAMPSGVWAQAQPKPAQSDKPVVENLPPVAPNQPQDVLRPDRAAQPGQSEQAGKSDQAGKSAKAGQAQGQHQESLQKIGSFINEQTTCVGHLNLAQLELQASKDWLKNVMQAVKTDPKGQDQQPGMMQMFNEQLQNADAWVKEMRQAGANDVFIIMGQAKGGNVPPAVVVVPIKDKSKAEQIQKLMMPKMDMANVPENMRPQTAMLHDAVVLAPQESMAAFKDAKPGDVKLLDEALSSVSDSALHFAFKPTPEMGRTLANIKSMVSEKARAEMEKGDVKALPENLKWIALGMQTPPQMNVKMIFKANDEQSAKQIAADITTVLQDAKQNKELRAQVTNLDQFVQTITPKVNGDQAVISLNNQQIESLVQTGKQEGQAQPAAGQQKGESQQQSQPNSQ